MSTEAWSGLDMVPADVRARLDALVGSEFGDAYSAACRTGSWEWATEWGAMIRGVLVDRGFEAIPDPAASWRVRWRPCPRCVLCGEPTRAAERVVGQASGPRGVILHDDEIAHASCLEAARA